MSKGSYRHVCTAPARGFTLIELLVVVAIIGVLAGIVLVSLGSARAGGADAGVKGNLHGMRTQAELYALQNSNTYGVFNGGSASVLSANQSTGLCFIETGANLFADPTIKSAIKAAQTSSGSSVTCYANGSRFAVVVGLRSTLTQGWCVDSSGNSGSITLSSAATTLNNNAGRCF